MQTTESKKIMKSKIFLMTKNCLPTATNHRKKDECNTQNKLSHSITTKNQFMEYGECKPLSDQEYYTLMTADNKGNSSSKFVEIIQKYYPELARFDKSQTLVYFDVPLNTVKRFKSLVKKPGLTIANHSKNNIRIANA